MARVSELPRRLVAMRAPAMPWGTYLGSPPATVYGPWRELEPGVTMAPPAMPWGTYTVPGRRRRPARGPRGRPGLGLEVTAQQGVAAAGTVIMTAAPLAGPYAPIVAGAGALLTLGSRFIGGKPTVPHAVREAREVAQVGGTVQGMISEIQGARTAEQLWRTLVKWQSGYVGGTSSVAVGVFFRTPEEQAGFAPVIAQGPNKATFQQLVTSGDVVLPAAYGKDLDRYLKDTGHAAVLSLIGPGNQNALYPVWTPEGFYRYLLQHSDQLEAGTQAGVTPGKLSPINQAVQNALLNKLDQFTGAYGGGGAGGAPAGWQAVTMMPPTVPAVWTGIPTATAGGSAVQYLPMGGSYGMDGGLDPRLAAMFQQLGAPAGFDWNRWMPWILAGGGGLLLLTLLRR